jgi:hypothetical protein
VKVAREQANSIEVKQDARIALALLGYVFSK